jgi:hypothetical protein
LQQLLCQ